MKSIWIGFDPREAGAYAVAKHTIRKNTTAPIPIKPLILDRLRASGMYWRETEIRDGRLFDVISDHQMATEFAISRFLVPALCGYEGFALFQDCDMLNRHDLAEIFDRVNPKHAVTVVKHDFAPAETIKMDGQVQSKYARKNWSSVMVFNCSHPANAALTVEMVNTLPGRDLHRFCWLHDGDIGELPVDYNWLVGHSPAVRDPAIVHFTDGIPTMVGYHDVPYANEWRAALNDWADAD